MAGVGWTNLDVGLEFAALRDLSAFDCPWVIFETRLLAAIKAANNDVRDNPVIATFFVYNGWLTDARSFGELKTQSRSVGFL